MSVDGAMLIVGTCMKVNQAAIDIIKHFESLHDGDLSVVGLQPKMCPAGIWTVGYGRALRKRNGDFMRGPQDKALAYAMYPSITEQFAEEMLEEDLNSFSTEVHNLLKCQPTENQFGSMVSLAYNIGVHAFTKSSVLRYFNSNQIEKAAEAFSLWNKSSGKILKGLVLRRKAEQQLFLTQD